MLNTVGDIMTEVLVRNNRTTTDGFISDTYLKAWVQDAHKWGAAAHKWPFTEGRVQTTYATGGGSNSDEFYFEGYKADSFRIVQVGGKRLDKLNFADYQILREDAPGRDDRVFADFGRIMFINPTADLSGTLVAYGQYEPLLDPTDLSSTTLFSNYDEEGNEAMVEKMSGYLKRRLHLTDEAELHDKRANDKLEEIWKRIQDEQYAYQTTPVREGMFKRFDVLRGQGIDNSELNNINQF